VSSWFLVCVITVRIAASFTVETKEHKMPSYDKCIEEKARVEKILSLPMLGGHRSFTLDCVYKEVGE
jgi:hypothetical protein